MTYRSSSGLSVPSVANSTSVVRTTRSPLLTFASFTKMAMFPENRGRGDKSHVKIRIRKFDLNL